VGIAHKRTRKLSLEKRAEGIQYSMTLNEEDGWSKCGWGGGQSKEMEEERRNQNPLKIITPHYERREGTQGEPRDEIAGPREIVKNSGRKVPR